MNYERSSLDRERDAEEARSETAVQQMWLIPLALFTGISLLAGWLVARAGGRYNTVRLVLFPMAFTISNFLFGLCMIPVFAIGLMATRGNMNVVGDLTLWNQIFAPLLAFFWNIPFSTGLLAPQPIAYISPVLVLIYQVIAWFAFGKWIMRNVALAFYDAANVKIAMETGHDVNDYRIYKCREDKSYLRDALFYENRAVMPPWSIVSVGMAGGFDVVDYYFGNS